MIILNMRLECIYKAVRRYQSNFKYHINLSRSSGRNPDNQVQKYKKIPVLWLPHVQDKQNFGHCNLKIICYVVLGFWKLNFVDSDTSCGF